MQHELLFEARLDGFEPHVLQTGKGHKNVKEELRKAIIHQEGANGIEEARRRIKDKNIRIEVEFRLWRGTARTPNTRAKKDLDNLLKPVLDVLQGSLDAQERQPGLGIIENDILVMEIVAKKRIVETEAEEGVRMAIFGL